MNDLKNCPLCGELIKSVAIKCKHCGSIFNSQNNFLQNIRIPPSDISTDKSKTTPNLQEIFLLSIWFQSFVFMVVNFFTSEKISFLILIICLCINFICYSGHRKQLTSKEIKNLPWYTNWFAFWILTPIALPLYLRYFSYTKKKYISFNVYWYGLSLCFVWIFFIEPDLNYYQNSSGSTSVESKFFRTNEDEIEFNLDQIQTKVANEAEQQYFITKKSGDTTYICTSAMGVVAAYLQLRDESNYNKWLNIQKQECGF